MVDMFYIFEVGIKVYQLQGRNLEFGKDTFLVQGPSATSGKARERIQVRTTRGPEIFATWEPMGGQRERMKVEGLGVTKTLESSTPANKSSKRYEERAEVRKTISPVPSFCLFCLP